MGGGDDLMSESDLQSVDDHPPAKPTPSKTRSVSEDPAPAPTSPLLARKTPARKTTDKEKASASAKDAETPSKPVRTASEKSASTLLSPAAPRHSTAPPLPPIKYAAAAAAAVQAAAAPPTVAPITTQSRPETVTSPLAEQVASPVAIPPTPEISVPPPPPGLSTQPPAQSTQQLAPPPSVPTSPQAKPSPAPSVAALSVGMANASLAASPIQSPSNGYSVPSVLSPQPPTTQPQQIPTQQQPTIQSVASQIQQSRQQQQIQVQQNSTTDPSAQHVGLPAAPQPPATTHTPNALSDLMTRFEEVKKNCRLWTLCSDLC